MVQYSISHTNLTNSLEYNQTTGVFTWKNPAKKSNKKIGSIAGSKELDGYIRITLNYKKYHAHILAWFYITGQWPSTIVDHKNTIKDDNRFCNLRLATSSENEYNKGLSSRNTSGYKGVFYSKKSKKYKASIGFNKENKTLGYFTTAEEAAEAYARAASQLHGEFARFSW